MKANGTIRAVVAIAALLAAGTVARADDPQWTLATADTSLKWSVSRTLGGS